MLMPAPKPAMEKAMTFMEYYRFTEQLANRKITNHTYSPEQMEYIRLNFFRMKRVLRNLCIPPRYSDQMKNINRDWYWLVIAEPWCVDAANNLPVIAMLAAQNMKIDLRILLRDQHPGVIDQHLTNGARSIPKLICYDQHMVETGKWGPRPKELLDHINELKETSSLSKEELKRQTQIWYNLDIGTSFLKEFTGQLLEWQGYRKTA